MARTKKETESAEVKEVKKEKKAAKEPTYYIVGLADTMIRISWKTNTKLDELKELNPHIKSVSATLIQGQKVRLS